MQLDNNEKLFESLIGWQIVGVERFDGRLLLMFTNGDGTRIVEVDRNAKMKNAR
jgi:hypothetical protein